MNLFRFASYVKVRDVSTAWLLLAAYLLQVSTVTLSHPSKTINFDFPNVVYRRGFLMHQYSLSRYFIPAVEEKGTIIRFELKRATQALAKLALFLYHEEVHD